MATIIVATEASTKLDRVARRRSSIFSLSSIGTTTTCDTATHSADQQCDDKRMGQADCGDGHEGQQRAFSTMSGQTLPYISCVRTKAAIAPAEAAMLVFAKVCGPRQVMSPRVPQPAASALKRTTQPQG